MKQENGKKSKKWLLIVIAIIALLAAAAVALVFILGGNNQGENQGETPVDDTPTSAVYFNPDRAANTDPETGLSAREPGEDGLYTIRFVSEGKIVELKTADKQLVNFIDTMDAVGLVLDESGLIIDVLNVKDIATENAKNFYVKKVDGNTITVNSSIAMNGMDLTFTLTDAAHIMDVREGSETLGQAIQLEVMDMVSVYSNKEEVVTSVFLHERSEASPLYLRVDRLYDSATASTTRVPDENGVYTIPFAIHGEVKQLKCKDKNIVTGIDSGTDSKQVMGLTFDEEGYITGSITAATAARGKLLCQVYNVTAINGNTIEATRLMSGSEQGKVVSFTLTEDTEIVMNEIGCNHFIGEYVEDLKDYDRIVVWSDMDGNAIYIKIDRRKVVGDDIAMYYLKGKLYDSTNKVTTRVPDAKGYYVYELASKGKMVTVKTKSKDIATLMDGNSYQFFGLKVKGGIVQEYYDANCLSGGYGIGGQRFVTEVMANIVRIVSGSDFASGANYMLTDKTEIYNMTGYNGKLGSKTTLQIGDRVIANRDVENNITHIYVLDRPASGSTKFYYNKSRSYSSTTLETTRTPDAEGYYVYTMYCEGKEVEVKTKDKDIATIIDQQNAPIAALKVNKDNIVTAAYPAIAGKKYASKVFNYNYVGEITKDKVVSCYYFSNGVKTAASKSYPMAKNCKVYNVSTNYTNYRGEKSTVKVGDQIQALYDIQTGELTHIWILGRTIDAPLYFHVARVAPVNGETARIPNAEGYYEIELFVDGKIKTFKTKDKAVMTAVDTYGSETFFTLKTDGDIILRADSASASKYAKNTKVSGQDVMKISGKTITTKRNRPAQSNTGATAELQITSKTKIYDVCYYSENQFKAVKLEKGDRITAYADLDGNITYIFVTYPHTRVKGYQAKCHHCNKTVWWEPYLGSFIATDEIVHYYLPTDRTRSQGTMGKSDQSIRYNAVFDMNGCTLTSTGRNFLVYGDLVVIDSVGGGILEAKGYQGGSGGNFLVSGGTVEINDGITLRMSSDPDARASNGGNFSVSNQTVGGKKYTGKITINDAKLEGWPNSSGNFRMSAGTVLNLNGGTVTGGNIELIDDAKLNWKGGIIESNLTINGGTLALSGKPNFTGILMTSNGGKVDISGLSTEASIKAVPSGVFTTESDNIDAYLNVFTSAAPDVCTIVKEGKALAAGIVIPKLTDNLAFVPGTQMAVCPACESMVTWKPITQAEYGEKTFGNASDGLHIYLAEDITYNVADSVFINAPSRNTTTNEPYVACFHLNGHNITGTYKNIAHGSYGILQFMGSGVVSGNNSSGATITMNTNRGTGGIHLLSGTYTKAAGNKTGVVQINSNGGNITIGKDAVVKTEEDDLAVKLAGGGCIDSNLIIQGTIEGGYVESVTASKQSATGDLDGNPNTIYFVLDGGNAKGGIKLAADTVIGLGGAAKVGGSGLNLTSGAKILVSELTDGASVAVAANGVFTADIDVDGQKGFYVPAPKYLPIEVVGKTLSIKRDPNAAPDLPKDPLTPAKPTVLSVDNSNLVFEEGTTNANCPVCNKVVTWTAITDVTGVQELEGGMHYYLPADITYEQATLPYIQAKNSAVSCLHLNGHNITATNAIAIEVKGKLNILGNGTVSGNGQPNETVSSRPDLQAATLQINAEGAVLNLYGGTYVKSAANDGRMLTVAGAEKDCSNNIVSAHGNGGTINLFDGATIDATGTKKKAVQSYWAYFNMYGGEVIGGDAYAIDFGNWTGSKSGRGVIHGGKITVTNTTYSAINVSGIAGAPGILEVYGGQIGGSLNYSRESSLIIGGAPYIKRVNVPANMAGTYNGLFTLGRLTEGADITVYGSNVIFTTQSENVETYKNYFKAQSGKEVYVKDYALALKAAGGSTPDTPVTPPATDADPKVPALPELLEVDNSNLVFEEGTNKAKCPVCGEVKEWTPITSADAKVALQGNTHYYLANDITSDLADSSLLSYEVYGKVVSCLHLNGHNLTATASRAIYVGGYLNIMGNGIVSGNYTKDTNRGATVDSNSTAARANIYGGTYVKTATNEQRIIGMSSTGTINIFKGVTVDARGTKGHAVQTTAGTINVYGGEIYGGDGGADAVIMAGYKADGVAGTVNFFGGKAQASMGSGLSASGSANAKPNLNIYGGEVRGNTIVKANANVTIGGTANMNMLTVNENCKITLAEMAEGASITVRANGIFTNPSDNAATYVAYFHGASGYKTPTVVEKALFTEQGTDGEQPAPEPEQPAFNNNNLIFEAGTTKAMCPACGEVKEWIAITQEAHGETGSGNPNEPDKHYYLAEDITYTGTANFFQGPGSSRILCIHLNGHNWTGTQGQFLFGYGSKSRVMGNGIVANGKNSARSGAVIWNTGTKTNVDIQLYGGTYTVTPENTKGSAISIDNNGGDITIHEGVKVIGSATAPAIYVGTSGARTSVLTIKGATVEGTVQINSPKTPDTYATTIVLDDAEVSTVELNKNVSFTVQGDTKIGKLIVAEGAKFTVGALGTNASINVQGNGVITEAGANVATYQDKIISTYGCKLSVVENALVAQNLNAIDNNDLQFAEGTTNALCPYCQKTVEWTAIKSTDTALSPTALSVHYYLPEDVTVNAADNGKDGFLTVSYGNNVWQNANVCLHLNGHNLTVQGHRAFMVAPGTLNVMGKGTVSGDNKNGATVHVNGANGAGTVNLLGGTYVKAAANTTGTIAYVGANGGTVNMYAGATIDGTGLTTADTAVCVRLSGTSANEKAVATFNMYGGTIQNGTNTTANGGNVAICVPSKTANSNAIFNMYDGTVTGGKADAQSGGNIYAERNTVAGGKSEVNLLGGTVSNGTARYGGNVSVRYVPVVVKNASVFGGVTSGSEAHGGNFSVMYSQITVEEGAKIYNGTAGSQGGNVRCYLSDFIMNGGEIYGGNCSGTAANHNVWVVGSATSPVVAHFNGGVITSTAEAVKCGSGMHISNNVTLYLANDATIVDPENATYAGLYVQGTGGQLKLVDGWSGTANVQFPSKYEAGAVVSVAQIVKVAADLQETVGGVITGTINQINGGTLAIEPQADGSLKIAG